MGMKDTRNWMNLETILKQKLDGSGLNGWNYMKLKDMERAPRDIIFFRKEGYIELRAMSWRFKPWKISSLHLM